MGIMDDALGNIVNRTKDSLSYKAGDLISGTAIKGAGKIANKVAGGKSIVLDKCPKCKAKIKPDAKFCPDCGQALVVTCTKCNVVYPLGTKFCTQCGGKLA